MNGLINRALQGFLCETYGRGVWETVCRDAGLGFFDFEAMLHYEPDVAVRVAQAAADRLDKSLDAFLEDVGTFLIAHPKQDPIRRLLRFGGADFRDFLLSLEELPSRAKLALPGLDLPDFVLTQVSASSFEIKVIWDSSDLAPIIIGAVRAMADDYGALVLLDTIACDLGHMVIGVELLDNSFAEGRSFHLGEAMP